MRFILTTALGIALALSVGISNASANGEVGQPAPDFNLENILDTQPDTFSIEGARGSVAVVAFWAWN